MSHGTVDSDDVIADYAHAYRMVYGQMPSAHYIRDGWYRVNGETVRHTVVLNEIENLRHLARQQRVRNNSKSAIQRLIDRLRGLNN